MGNRGGEYRAMSSPVRHGSASSSAKLMIGGRSDSDGATYDAIRMTDIDSETAFRRPRTGPHATSITSYLRNHGDER